MRMQGKYFDCDRDLSSFFFSIYFVNVCDVVALWILPAHQTTHQHNGTHDIFSNWIGCFSKWSKINIYPACEVANLHLFGLFNVDLRMPLFKRRKHFYAPWDVNDATRTDYLNNYAQLRIFLFLRIFLKLFFTFFFCFFEA